MADVFLYGDIDETFADVTAPFVDAVVRRGQTIALLLQGGEGWEQYVARYAAPWTAHADVRVIPIVPRYGSVEGDDITTIANADGIFMGGGHTRSYYSAFVDGPVGDVIREQVATGVAYGGVSAGALLASETSIVAGNVIDGRRITALTDTEGEIELDFAPGLGLVDAVVDAHLTELGNFPRLLEAVVRIGARTGIGIDEPAGVHVAESVATVLGAGSVFVVQNQPASVLIETKRPGDRFRLRPSE